MFNKKIICSAIIIMKAFAVVSLQSMWIMKNTGLKIEKAYERYKETKKKEQEKLKEFKKGFPKIGIEAVQEIMLKAATNMGFNKIMNIEERIVVGFLAEDLSQKGIKGGTIFDHQNKRYEIEIAKKYIFYGGDRDELIYTIFHELAHIFLGHFVVSEYMQNMTVEDKENQADWFAIQALIESGYNDVVNQNLKMHKEKNSFYAQSERKAYQNIKNGKRLEEEYPDIIKQHTLFKEQEKYAYYDGKETKGMHF